MRPCRLMGFYVIILLIQDYIFMGEKTEQLQNLLAKHGYDHPAVPPIYDEALREDFPARYSEFEDIAKALPEKILLGGGREVDLKEATAIELGAGTGEATAFIKNKVGQVICLDKAASMVLGLKNKFKDDIKRGKVKPLIGEMTKIPLKDNAAEIVVSLGAIFELPPGLKAEDDFFHEVMRVLKPGGIFILDGVCNPKFKDMKSHFVAGRSRELAQMDYSGSKVSQRFYVFLANQLQARLEKLNYECQVEPFLDDESSPYCPVKITLLKKIQKNES